MDDGKSSTPSAFRARRVAVLLEGLALHLQTAAQRAGEIQPSESMPQFVVRWAKSSRKEAYLVRRWPVQHVFADDNQVVRVDEGKEKIVRAALINRDDRIEAETESCKHGQDLVFDLRDKECVRYDLLLEFATRRIVRVIHAVQVDEPAGAGPGGRKD
jgi:hypothetical protein